MESRKNGRSGFRETTGSSVQVAQTDLQGKQGGGPPPDVIAANDPGESLPFALGGLLSLARKLKQFWLISLDFPW